jgi:hypothetical protein
VSARRTASNIQATASGTMLPFENFKVKKFYIKNLCATNSLQQYNVGRKYPSLFIHHSQRNSI